MRVLFAAASLALVATPAFAAVVNSLIFASVPALDDAGLIAVSVVVGIAGAIAARRRRKNRQ